MNDYTICFDIETGPLPAEYLNLIAPAFEAPSNYKDEEKIAAHIADQKARWMDRAALSPMTGRVVCIGVRMPNGDFVVIHGGGDESKLLEEWADLVKANRGRQFVGFNILSFDLPFLVRRAWQKGVRPCLRPGTNLRRLENWTDLREVWQMGDKQTEGSLDAIAKFLGVGEKNGNGKDFAALWESDRDAAIEYLRNDLRLTYAIGERMGVIA